MNDLSDAAWPFLIPIVAIVGGVTAGIVATISKGRVRELEIRERIAMIERGLMPPPEQDPAGFERRMEAMDRMHTRSAAPRFRTAGIIIMSIGFGLMTLISFAGAVQEGIGVGGFLVILGLGFLVNSLFSSPSDRGPHPPAPPPAPPSSPNDSRFSS